VHSATSTSASNSRAASKSRRNDVSRRDEISFKKLQFSLRRPHTRLVAAAAAAAAAVVVVVVIVVVVVVVIVAAPRRLSIYSACVVTTCAAFAPSFYSHAGGARGGATFPSVSIKSYRSKSNKAAPIRRSRSRIGSRSGTYRPDIRPHSASCFAPGIRNFAFLSLSISVPLSIPPPPPPLVSRALHGDGKRSLYVLSRAGRAARLIVTARFRAARTIYRVVEETR